MKKACLILLLLVPCVVLGGEMTKSVMSRVSDGSVVLTNDLRIGTSELPSRYALELKRIEFTIPVNWTNTFTIAYVRTYAQPDTFVNRVYTQTVGGVSLIHTNLDRYAGSNVTYTNSIAMTATTNNTSLQVYDLDDFDRGLTFEPDDVITYSFSYTGAFDLIQVYTRRERP